MSIINTSLSALRDTNLSSKIATQAWTEENFTTLDITNQLSGEVVDGLSNVVVPRLDAISGLVKDETEKLDAISAELSTYAKPADISSAINTLDGIVTGTAGAGKTLTSFSQTDGKVTAGFADIAITKSQITDFPTIPTVNDGTLKIQKNGSDVATFTANQSNNVTANISVPTKTSDITNDSGFITSSDADKKYMPLTGTVIVPDGEEFFIGPEGDSSLGLAIGEGGTSGVSLCADLVFAGDINAFGVIFRDNTRLTSTNQIPSDTNQLTNGAGFITSAQVDEKIDAARVKTMEYQGTKTTYAELPSSGNKQGDVWNVVSAYNENPPGTNYAWTGTTWDPLGGTIDVSVFATKAELNDLSAEVIDGLSNEVLPKLSAIGDLTIEQSQKIDAISSDLSSYAKLSATKLSVQNEYTEWVLTPSWVLSDNPSSPYPEIVGKTIHLEFFSNQYINGWQPYVGSNAVGSPLGEISSTEILWNVGVDWAGAVALSAKRYKKGAVLGNQTSATLALENHSHALSDIANLPGVVQTGSYNDLLDKPTNFLSAETDPIFNNWLSGNSIAAGNGATVTVDKSVAIGVSSVVGDGGYGSIAIGMNSFSQASQRPAIAIGAISYANKSGNVAIGTACRADTAANSIAIGLSAHSAAGTAIAIGARSNTTANYAIQLGTGTNSQISTFQVYNWQLLESNGNIPEARVSAIGYIKGADVPLSDYTPLSTTLTLSDEVVYEISTVINPKLNTIVSLVSGEVEKLDELSGKLDDYALTSDIPLSVSQLINDSGYITSSYVSLSAVEKSSTLVLTEEQKTALVQSSGIPAEAYGDFAISVRTTDGMGYIGSVFCFSAVQNENGDWVFVGGMPALNVLGWVANSTVIQGSEIHTILSVDNVSVDIATKDELAGYLPLNGGGVVTGNIAIQNLDGDNLFSLNNYGKVAIGAGASIAPNAQYGVAIGANAYAANSGIAINGRFANGISANNSCIAIGDSVVSGGYDSIQLGYANNNSDALFRVWKYPMLEGNGDIPYGRLSANIDKLKILPISATTDASIALTKNTYVYRITDSNNTGTFPTLVAPADITQTGDYYFTFEIEWTTAASVGSYSGGYDWITYPEFAGDGSTYTYYIAGRWDSSGSGGSAFTLNCWRAKKLTA